MLVQAAFLYFFKKKKKKKDPVRARSYPTNYFLNKRKKALPQDQGSGRTVGLGHQQPLQSENNIMKSALNQGHSYNLRQIFLIS
jgi:hypothetical protein